MKIRAIKPNRMTSAKKRIFSLFLVLSVSLPIVSAQVKNDISIKTVVIDPGHGGKDPGAIGGGKTKEKDVALSVSLKLGDLIKKHYSNVKVVYTRSTDVFIGLAERASKANKIQADLFISVHANAAENKKAYGAEVWVLGLHKSAASMKVAMKENSSILMEDDHGTKYQDFDPEDPDSYIGLSMRQNAFLDQSLHLANGVQNHFVNGLSRKNRGVKQAGFMVLYRSTMPSILVELGFLSHVEEEKYLASTKGQNELAQSIFEGFKDYKLKVDGVNAAVIDPGTVEPPRVERKKIETPEKEEEHLKDKVVFKVQIAASSVSIETSPDNFKGLTNVEQYQANGIYKYTVGNFLTFAEAKARQKEVKRKGFDAGFIVAFRNGERLTNLQEAIQLAKQN